MCDVMNEFTVTSCVPEVRSEVRQQEVGHRACVMVTPSNGLDVVAKEGFPAFFIYFGTASLDFRCWITRWRLLLLYLVLDDRDGALDQICVRNGPPSWMVVTRMRQSGAQGR